MDGMQCQPWVRYWLETGLEPYKWRVYGPFYKFYSEETHPRVSLESHRVAGGPPAWRMRACDRTREDTDERRSDCAASTPSRLAAMVVSPSPRTRPPRLDAEPDARHVYAEHERDDGPSRVTRLVVAVGRGALDVVCI